MRLFTATLLSVLLAAPAAGLAQSHPGFVDFENLRGLEDSELVVDVKLGGWLLGWARSVADQSDDEDLDVLSSIDSIRVRVFELNNAADVVDSSRDLAEELRDDGWEDFAQVKDKDETVFVMVKGSAAQLDGITVIAVDHDHEAVFVNVAGRLDPADIARILDDQDLIHADLDLDLDV